MRASDASSSSTAGTPHVLALATTGLVDCIGRAGGNAESIFDRVGLSAHKLLDPMNSLPLQQYCHLFETTARQTGDDAFGLRFGAAFRPRSLGALGYVTINAPTLGAGLRKLCQYFDVCQGASVLRLVRDGALLRLEYQIHDGRITRRRQDAELTLGIFANIFRHCHGPGWRFTEVHFEHPRPADTGEHRRLFDAPVYFGQRINALVFEAEAAAATMPDPDAFAMMIMESYLAGRRLSATAEDFEVRLRHAVTDCFDGGGPRLETVAQCMKLTRAQLLRRMAQRRIDFNEVVRGVRREHALRFLAEPQLPLTEIALMLGYSELSAFSRAFRGWTGVSPLRYRQGAVTRGAMA